MTMKQKVKHERKPKPSKIWTRGQIAFLLSFKDQFEQAQANQNTRELWPIIFAHFFKKYPTAESELLELEAEKREAQAEGPPADEGEHSAPPKSKKAKRAQAKLMEDDWPKFVDEASWRGKRETQIQAWYYNMKAGARSQPKVQVVVAPPAPVTRVLPEHQVYSRMFYDKRVKAKVDAKLEGQESSEEARVTVINCLLHETYENKSQEVKEAVRKEREAMVQKTKMEGETISTLLNPVEGTQTAEDFARFQGILRTVIDAFFVPVAEKSGWTFTVLGAGPDSTKPNGRITTSSYHYGLTPEKKDFFAWHPSFNETYMNPFSSFAHRVFVTEEVRQSRSLEKHKLAKFMSRLEEETTGKEPTKGTSGSCSKDLLPTSFNGHRSPPTFHGGSTASSSSLKQTTFVADGGTQNPLSTVITGQQIDDQNVLATNPLGFNPSGHPASLEPAPGSLMEGLVTRPFVDYADAAGLVEPRSSLEGLDYSFNQIIPFDSTNISVEPMNIGGGNHHRSPAPVYQLPVIEADGPMVSREATPVVEGAMKGGRKRKPPAAAAEAEESRGKRSRRVNNRQEMPMWMVQAKTYLERDLDLPEWATCLSKWWDWESRSASIASTTVHLPATAQRPAEVSKWIQKKTFASCPKFKEAELKGFSLAWLDWWEAMKLAGEAGMRRPGQSGVVLALISLKWWAGLSESDGGWKQAVGEFSDMMDSWLS
ncbi:hypothetical protein BKA70DRAFT_1446157 [Coprinopsis sp. MPI-PUGE-AT-0042]|nr:hypothetical protein BKA70DRAFT_1446157 [Coprinopsis sp. MPI-PUGE-AT-0042]